MSEVTIDSSLFALVGLLFVALSIPLIQGRVPPNRYYGFRTPKTLSKSEIWYEVNRISGHDLFIAGALISIASLTMLVFAQRWEPRNVAVNARGMNASKEDIVFANANCLCVVVNNDRAHQGVFQLNLFATARTLRCTQFQ